jgi:hypothetical protein
MGKPRKKDERIMSVSTLHSIKAKKSPSFQKMADRDLLFTFLSTFSTVDLAGVGQLGSTESEVCIV